MDILKDRFLIFLLLFGLLLRLILSTLPGFKVDVDAWFAWAIRLNQTGFANFYSDQIWTNYTPGFLYVLGLLGYIKNLLQISDPSFYSILKFPAIISEIILAFFVYRQFGQKSLFWARIAAISILFNPAFVFNSSVWGQIDGLLSLILILAIYFLIKKKLVLSAILLGLGFLIKPQTVAILPIFVLFFIRHLSVKNFLRITAPFLLTMLLLSLPFFINQPFSGLIKLFSEMVSDYPYTSLFAYNFWGAVGFWIPDNKLWSNLSYQNWGYILLAGYWITISYFYLKKKLSLYTLASLAALAFFFLPTRVHDRYLYPALIFLIFSAALLKSHLILLLTSFLSILHLLNLYYVYTYYNHFFLKLPGVIYSPPTYNFLESSGKGLSIVSTIIFILLSISIIKYNVISKKD